MTPVNRRAGTRLRRRLNAMLNAAERELGTPLEWSEPETEAIERAANAANHAAHLWALYDELAGAGDVAPTVLTKLSTEARGCDRAVMAMLAKVNPLPGPQKSEQHQRAVNARWAARDARWAAARGGA